MSRIILMRHAQASFADGGSLTDGYDQLSALGFKQSAALAEELVESGIVFDRIVLGSLVVIAVKLIYDALVG